ncbi:hypothetical protein JHX88_03545 [Paracoccus saliphilus]|uniref:DDE superfamily endonuclease n=1 Tax=Paracoccus saliphilus TaxID=405559 RepID=A0ABY7SEY3_9RHOB|nr:hypothetical protein JHX88_03545 [Paracoccus saliphilus]
MRLWWLYRCLSYFTACFRHFRPEMGVVAQTKVLAPDLNPIEMAFAKLKAYLRRIGARGLTQVFEAIAEICDMFSPQECRNLFRAAGYVAG